MKKSKSSFGCAIPKAILHIHAESGAQLDRLVNRESTLDWARWIDATMSTIPPEHERLKAMPSVPLDTALDVEPIYLEARFFDLMLGTTAGSTYSEFRFGAGSRES
jgi:hypothetical protein